MKLYKLYFVLTCIILVSCSRYKTKKVLSNRYDVAFDFGTWVSVDKDISSDVYKEDFKRYKKGGIDEILVNTQANPSELERIVTVAKEVGLKVHAWVTVMNRPNDSIALKHPDWYIVSREGKSCFDTRPYVDYYQWLCPIKKASRTYVLNLVEGLAKVPGIESVHLDYIRFPDVFLPVGLLGKYNLKQEEEVPEFDFCYCNTCVSRFESIHHKNPKNMVTPSLDIEWENFRLNAIRAVVNDAYVIAKKYQKKLTAAVFPYPEMASNMVRQRWDKWNIDEVYPMVYHGFYNEEIDWIAYVTKQGVEDLLGKNIGLHTALYLPDFSSKEELKKAINYARINGAKGVAFYDGKNLKEDYFEVIIEIKEGINKWGKLN